MTEELHIFYLTKYSDVDEFTKELSGYIEDLLSAQKKELLEKIEKLEKFVKIKETTIDRAEIGNRWYRRACEDIKKLLT